jgi:HSP20 family molecular chaperone IbpA
MRTVWPLTNFWERVVREGLLSERDVGLSSGSITGFLQALENDRSWDSFIKDGVLHMQTEIPGYDPRDVQVIIENGVLDVKARRTVNGGERTISRSVRLRDDLDVDAADSVIRFGILEITIPLKDKRVRKKVLCPSSQES